MQLSVLAFHNHSSWANEALLKTKLIVATLYLLHPYPAVSLLDIHINPDCNEGRTIRPMVSLGNRGPVSQVTQSHRGSKAENQHSKPSQLGFKTILFLRVVPQLKPTD